MKEMTIQEKADRFDEAIERLRNAFYDNGGRMCEEYRKAVIRIIEPIFPELKESEDEIVRKWIIDYLNNRILNSSILDEKESCKKAIAWLKKQGEQKPVSKVEPKFKVGDKIRKKTPSSFDRDMQVARIEKDYYVCNHIGKFSSEVVSFSKESSYELVEQNPAWSGEDKNAIQVLKDIVEHSNEINENTYTMPLKEKLYDWLKSLKNRVGCEVDSTTAWKPNEEQMKALDIAIRCGIQLGTWEEKALKELGVQLNKLREE